MNPRARFFTLLAALAGLSGRPALAQTPAAGQATATAEPMALSLPQAIDYAIKHKSTLQSLRLDEQIAAARVKQTKADGLPQLSGQVTVTDNYQLQKSLVDASAFGGAPAPTLNPFTLTGQQLTDASNGKPIVLTPSYTTAPVVSAGPQPFTLGLQWSGNGALSASQKLFDGSYLVGLKAAKVYQSLSVRQTRQSEVDVVEQVSKAYYSTLVARERRQLLDRNVQRLDTLLYQTQKTFEVGYAEKLDVQRLQVQLNNLLIQRRNADRSIEVSVALLRFQMGLDQSQPVTLTDRLDAAVLEAARQKLLVREPDFNYANRPEYQVLQVQRDLADLDVRNQKSAYLPKLSLVATHGWLGFDKTAGGLFEFRGPKSTNSLGYLNQNWFSFGNVGLQLQIPIFDGFRRRNLVQEAKLNVEKTTVGFTTLKQNIDLQRAQTGTDLRNDIDVLGTQRENLDLATEVARVSKVKFQAGVGSNVELINAETDLREAQTNYYAAIYDALVSKVDYEKAQGTLYQPQ